MQFTSIGSPQPDMQFRRVLVDVPAECPLRPDDISWALSGLQLTALERITDEFYPLQGFGKARPSVARKAIRDYRRASGNLAGTAELMLTYVEYGTGFARDCYVNDERFYDSLSPVLRELVSLLSTKAPELYPRFRERFLALQEQTARTGWGYGEAVANQVGVLEDDFETASP